MQSKQYNGKTISKPKICYPNANLKLSDFSSTLLIPNKYLTLFQTKLMQHKGVARYIAYLLSKYQIFIANGMIPGYSNVTTKYQEKGQNLQKVSFRPRPEDWAELKLYRVSFGMSISAFLVYLLIADSVELAATVSNYLETVGISAIPNFHLSAKVYLWNQKTYYSTVFQYRKSHYH
ncbi:MAG TPA: DUF1564 family protein [Leptospiraceae bacterium]|nr:DUF1564 family protein [Leptospiraceae bacterium]HMW07750.1 DUF1564 family protein [Leptospiraceae bacterium]HMX31980.1 DUF1564 family protein [Leptospiraceae bacterium]HMY33416.1 DUF1564 family protein [Leptospiraceae bacterium]HMZ64776.1 DUF1564 family protein [Leptospiraceae bacterium]